MTQWGIRMYNNRAYDFKGEQSLFLGGTVKEHMNVHRYYGIHRVRGGWVCRIWEPEARQVCITGEFNGWDQTQDPMLPVGDGSWVVYLPGDDTLWDSCRIKTVILQRNDP